MAEISKPLFDAHRHTIAMALMREALQLHVELQRAGVPDQQAATLIAEAHLEAAVTLQRTAHLNDCRQPDLRPLATAFIGLCAQPFRLVDSGTLEPVTRN